MKVGDIVRLKPLSECISKPQICMWTYGMNEFAGKIFIIKSIDAKGTRIYYYLDKAGGYSFIEDWIDEVLNKED